MKHNTARGLVAILALALTVSPAAAAGSGNGKGKPTAQATATTPAPKSTTGASQRMEINVTGSVAAVATTDLGPVSITLKTIPQGKNKIGPTLKKGDTITVVITSASTVKRNGVAIAPASLVGLKATDKVTVRIVSVTVSGSGSTFTAQSIIASGV